MAKVRGAKVISQTPCSIERYLIGKKAEKNGGEVNGYLGFYHFSMSQQVGRPVIWVERERNKGGETVGAGGRGGILTQRKSFWSH